MYLTATLMLIVIGTLPGPSPEDHRTFPVLLCQGTSRVDQQILPSEVPF